MEDVSLGDFSGKNVLVLFVPLAFTGVCTRELCDISAGINAYEDLGAQVLGISVDSPFSLKAWAEKEGITIPLLSDFNKEVSAAYGAQFADLRGFKGVAKRSAFVIDGEGVVRYASVSDDPKQLPDFAAIKACLQSLN
jgi:peroxiredoxin